MKISSQDCTLVRRLTFDLSLIVRRTRVKIALNVVKASKLVQMKLITHRSKLGSGHFENFLLLFVRQYGCFRQRQFTEEEILEKVSTYFMN